MATPEGKAAVSKWQSAVRRTNRKTKIHSTARKAVLKSRRRATRFLEARGKTVEFVEFSTDSGFHIVDIGFQDRTALHFILEPTLSVEPGYSNWKTGNERILRRWAPVVCS